MQLKRTADVTTGSNNDKLLLNNNTACKTMGSRTINSTVLHNPSFLHGDIVVVGDDKHVSKNTIDSLALRRASLPLQLVPNDIVCIDNNTDLIICDNESAISLSLDDSSSIVSEKNLKELASTEDNGVKERISTEFVKPVVDYTATNKADIDLKDDVHHKDVDVSWENKTETKLEHKLTITRPKRYCPSSKFGCNGNKKFIVKPKWIFARNVLHYVPKHKRTRKLINNILPINKNKDKDKDKNINNINDENNWPRRNVSLPSNFVHVAGARRWSWLQDIDDNDNSRIIINHKEKCATLTLIGDRKTSMQIDDDDEVIYKRSSSAETLVEENIKEPVEIVNKRQPTVSMTWSSRRHSDEELAKTNNGSLVYLSKPKANVSFLWSSIAKCSGNDDNNKKLDKLDGVEPCDHDEYDDVGLPSIDSLDDTYDDVGVPELCVNGSVNYEDEQVYDDVMLVRASLPAKISAIEKENDNNNSNCSGSEHDRNADKFFTNKEINEKNVNEFEKKFIYMRNDYSTVDEDADDEVTVYDDVGVVLCESRVNSIYAGSLNIGQLDPSKESEWEDLDENLSVNGLSKNLQALLRNSSETQSAWSNKKKSGQRRTRKVRRQRSKASRKNSARSANRVSRQSTISDTCSDDSNYETLYSFEPYESNQVDSVDQIESKLFNTSASKSITSDLIDESTRERNLGAPLRPVPPPPRESSLTGTFGKRMKMLKRTWSITKGSLGRMRRRTSGSTETDSNADDLNIKSGIDDGRKSSQVFSFKKHFQRSSTTSTFYLDNDNDTSVKNNNNINNSASTSTSCDDIYENSNWINANYSKRDTNTVDDYNILAEEPLYQFYAASTFRGAFQSDSDSYGDTEDSLPSASELGRPGYRTLWCQTPQVIKSGLLEQLTSDEKKLQEAKFEIITSEASYLNSLRVLVNEFLINHELVYEALSATDREKLFGSVPSVLIASERLLAELESVWRGDPMLKGLPEVLLKHAERCSKIYIDYCSNQVSIDLTLKELRLKKSSKFIETVTRIESHPACQSLSLHSFLMLPMQRVTRLPLLADAVLSKLSTEHEERLDWEKVLSVLGRVVTECNEGARVAGRQIEMASLAKKIEYTTKVPPIDLRDRYLVRSGSVTQILAKPGAEYVLTFRKKFNKTPLYLLLLTDHLLIAKLKTNNQDEIYSVIDSCKRSLIALEKVPDDSPFAGRYAMILTLLDNYCSRHVEYILSCQNATERERWLDAVSPPKPNLVGETLYETWDCPQVMALYSYTPVQPDELSLQPGDVINVLRKMADGWNLGEKLVGGEQGWFPGNYTKEVASEHVRAKNLRQRHRLLALSESLLQQYAKQSVCINR
ncbi:uncharacterized protein LOC130668493 isoform X2 [Microplitis mediator]|uniref:uncharacterized protein LOC130668493 isoform X2 n=1 Tax=Microplitis mediator TaxID=375433 RepID=UPI0025521B1F|nr:uncharacterized protein LOC130668493 isoform X2 [Microplitis mediator]